MTEKKGIGPFVLPAGQWNRRLHAPYHLIIQDVRTGVRRDSVEVEHLEAALRALVEMDEFPMRSTRCVVVDEDGWIVFGYSTDPKYIERMGDTCWLGSEVGFSTLESLGLIDPMELAVMESVARGGSDGEDWYKR